MSRSIPPSQRPASRLAFPGAMLAGKFRLEQPIGHGGMGSVWAATHVGLNQPCAVKLIATEFVKSSEALRRFDTEAKAAAQIQSRFVPQVYDNGVLEDGTPYIAMELLHGESLYTRVHIKGPIALPEAVNILSQCCRALGRAHSLGIIHRDIKPDNIYLARSVDDDGEYVVKILDFGIAKILTTGDDQHSATRTGTLLGTPLYMSPEQARGLRTVDHRTDIYSLGLVSYTMLTGNLAFSGESFGDLLLQICTSPLPILRAAAPWLPESMEAWFQQACARDPEQRWESARAMLDGLRRASGIAAPEIPTGAMQAVPDMRGPAPGLARPPAVNDSGVTAPAPPRPQAAPQWAGMLPQNTPAAQLAPPPMQQTPMPMQQTPMPMQQTPMPGQPMAVSTTGAAMMHPEGIPKRGPGLAVALVAAIFLLLAGGGAAAMFVLHGKKEAPATAGGPSAAAIPTVSAAATTTPPPPASASAEALEPLKPAETATPHATAAPQPHRAPAPPVPAPPPAKPAPAPAPPHVNCNPPYYINSQGIKVPKPGC